MAKWTLPPSDNKNSNSIFDLQHHGDEVIVALDDKQRIRLAIKTQTGRDEHRSTLLTFDTQTQCERLLPAIMKGLR